MPKRPTSLIILDCFQNEWKFLHETSLPDYLMLPRFGERVLKFCAETVLVDFDHRAPCGGSSSHVVSAAPVVVRSPLKLMNQQLKEKVIRDALYD